MTAGLPLIAPLVAATLVVLTAVAGLPALLLASRQAQPRNPPPGPETAAPVQLVLGGTGRWFLNGQPIAEDALGRMLRQPRLAQAPLRLQASGRLPAAAVSRAMAWLRRQSGMPVNLDLPLAGP